MARGIVMSAGCYDPLDTNNSEIGKISNSQDEIADEVGCDSRTVRDVLAKTEDLPESLKPDANHLTEFQTSTE